MTTITITFLCNIVIDETKLKKPGKKKKDKKNKKGKKDAGKTEEIQEIIEEPTIIPLTINVSKPVTYLHIEYNLLPSMPLTKIDVAFWGPVAKCFRVKKDTVKLFSFRQEDIELELNFIEAFENVELVDTEMDIRSLLYDLLGFPIERELLSCLRIIPDKNTEKMLMNLIDKIMNGKEIKVFNSCVAEEINVKDLLKDKKKKGGKGESKSKAKSKKGKGKGGDLLKLSIHAEILFTDPKTTYNFRSINKEVVHGFLIINVDKLIDCHEVENVYPIIVNVDEIQNLPVEILTSNGFSFIYISYEIGNINHETTGRIITNTICFQDHHIHFVNDSVSLKFCEQIQSGYLIIQIHGVKILLKKDLETEFDYSTIGTLAKNKQEIVDVTRKEQEKKAQSFLLAVAYIKLDTLINPLWKISTIVQCQNPTSVYSVQNEQIPEKITLNTINVNPDLYKELSPLISEIILKHELSLTLEIKLFKPIKNALTYLQLENKTYNRIIVFIYDLNLAKSVISTVVEHNLKFVDDKNILPNFTKKNVENEYENLITGFVIDCANFYVMFLEGLWQLIENFVWDKVKDEQKTKVKILYNSEYLFEKRLYSYLSSMGGVYFITLYQHLLRILKRKKCSYKGYLPEPCRKALTKLRLILQSEYMVEIPVSILPTVKELISLDIEWGVPIYYNSTL